MRKLGFLGFTLTLYLLLQPALVRAVPRPSAKNKENPIPMYFDTVNDGVDVLPLEVDYDLETDNGDALRLGNLQIDSGNFFADILPLSRLDSRLSKLLPKDSDQEFVFLFRWPDYVMRQGTLEVISRTGRVLWSIVIDQKEQAVWKSQLEAWKSLLIKSGVNKADILQSPLFNTQFGLRDAKNKKTPFWDLDESFRLCFSQREGIGQTRLCSAWQEVLREKKKIKISTVPLSPQPPRVIVMNDQGKLSDSLQVAANKPVQFFAELRSGLSYEFLAIPHAFNLIDAIEDPNKKIAIMVTEGDQPLAAVTPLHQDKKNAFVELIGWEETIGDFRKFWRSKIDLKDPFLMITGTGGGAFKQRFVIKKLPREEMRPYLSERTVEGTYVDGVKVFGRKTKEQQISSLQNSVEVDKDDPMEFAWRFGAKNRGEMNHSQLLLQDGDRSFKAYHEIFKGYPRELSTRLSGIFGSEGNYTIFAEAAFNYWFEDILGWTNYYLSRQRWGLSAKAFRSMTNVKVSDIQETLQVFNVDMKFRLNPGLWARDETWGLMTGLQNVSYGEFNMTMVGGGVFWARSMPKVFDDLANRFPFMSYPKWVDMEFIYYMLPETDSYKLRGAGSPYSGYGNWQLNFHGQVMWTKEFFGEAGFGLKQYDFVHEIPSPTPGGVPRKPNFTLTTFYGTAGIGYKF